LPSKEEFAVVKSYLQKIASVNTFEEIYRQKTAFEDTYKLLATARTFGCSTVHCVNQHFLSSQELTALSVYQ
jgi:hypothetical protein